MHRNKNLSLRILLAIALVPALSLASGCATTENARDPLEPLNRTVHAFNSAIDDAVLEPVAKGYQAVTPDPVDRAITNFFNNIGDVVVAANNLLQLKVLRAFEDAGRVVVNSTVGLLGLVDIASDIGIEKHDEDFGQTLGYWGIADGPYLVLPLLGPSTLRDTAGLFVDAAFFDPIFYIDDFWIRSGVLAAKFIDRRADLMSTERIVDEAALDRYIFIRDAYLQRRRYLIYDGYPPVEQLPDDAFGLDAQ